MSRNESKLIKKELINIYLTIKLRKEEDVNNSLISYDLNYNYSYINNID